MPRITYINDNNEARTVEAKSGESVMSAALANSIDGILAECGGAAMCATCHVYVEPEFIERLPPVAAIEDAMLESAAAERKPSSRLSCQLAVTDDLDGLVVRLPETQS